LRQTEPAQEVILGPDSHIYEQELGGAAAIAGVMIKTWANAGIPSTQNLSDTIQPDYRFPTKASPQPALVCLENSHNASGGTVISAQEMHDLAQVIHEAGLKLHLDGARIFNAAASLQIDPAELCEPADSLIFSLDKCLSAPFGAMLLGSKQMITKARHYRRMLGGYTRKIAIFAAAGVIALEKMRDRVSEDNQRAASLGELLHKIECIRLEPYPIPTNLIMIDLSSLKLDPQAFVERLQREYQVIAHIYGKHIVRLAIHRHIGKEEQEHIASAIESCLSMMIEANGSRAS
jgi:threonine aldolase